MLAFLNGPTARGAAPAPDQATIFAPVSHATPANRVALASSIYMSHLRRGDEATAMASLNSLRSIAQELDDKPLECSIFNLRADYYSVNRGFNPISTAYYQKAVDFAAVNKMPVEKGIYLNDIGRYFFVFKLYAPACRYFLQAQEQFKQAGYNNVPVIYAYLSQFADLYYALGDFENAKINLEQALIYVPAGSRASININNTLGLIYRASRQFPKALIYLNKAEHLAIANKDTVWRCIVAGNIGSVYFLEGKYQKAIPLIESDYKTSLTYGEPINGALALLRLIKINIDIKNYSLAYHQLTTIDSLIKNTTEDVLGLLANYDDLKSQLYEQTGRLSEAIACRKLYELYKDSISKRNNITAVERVKLQWEIDKHATQLNKLKADEQIRLLEMNAGLAVLILLTVILVLLYNRQRSKSKKDKEVLLAEKRVVDEDLQSAVSALRRFTENLRQKNVLIENSRKEIEKLSRQSAINADAHHLEELLQAHIMTDENWGDFRKLFSKMHPGFFVNLSKNYPQLSATDTRLLALIKLGLNNAEMAGMLGITIEGVKKAKQRLRKKVDINSVGGIAADSTES